MKIRTKITLLFATLVTAILLLISFSVYYLTSIDRANLASRRLRSRAIYNAQLFSILEKDKKQQLDRLNNNSILQIPGLSVRIFNLQGNELYKFERKSSIPLNIDNALIRQVLLNGEIKMTINKQDILVLYPNDIGSTVIVMVAAYDSIGWTRLNDLQRLLILTSFFGIIISLVGGFLFSKQLLGPIGNMIREVNLITSNNLNTSINIGRSKDEINLLAATFNNLLNRLQESFISQRRFISSASHELSTPLTSISSQLQVALQRERNIDEYKNVIKSVHEDVQQMLQLTKSLLEIAKTGDHGSIELKEVRVDELLFNVMVDVQKLNGSYNVEINFDSIPEDDSMLLVFGNSELLAIAFKNVIENGCKFSWDHMVNVDLAIAEKEVRVKVSNKGPVIEKTEQERIFNPFYRSNNSRNIAGFGLGLSLAKRIIGLHRGTIQLNSVEETGTVFLISLPCSNVATPVVS